MDWYKHSTGSHDDPDVSDAMDEFGHVGYAVFFITLEIYGQEYNHIDPDGWLRLSRRFLARKLRLSSTKVEQILNYYSERQRIIVKSTKNDLLIRCPKFIDIASNWTKRKTPKPTEPLQSPSVVPTAIEEEEKKNKKKNILLKHERAPFSLPDKEELQESSIVKTNGDMENVCKQLYDENIFPEVYAFRGKMLKAKKNEKAILHSLCRCYLSKPEEPWAFCKKILDVEDGNYNERDYSKAHQ